MDGRQNTFHLHVDPYLGVIIPTDNFPGLGRTVSINEEMRATQDLCLGLEILLYSQVILGLV